MGYTINVEKLLAMTSVKIAAVEAALVFSGNSFQDLTARMKNKRLANSVRARDLQMAGAGSPGCS